MTDNINDIYTTPPGYLFGNEYLFQVDYRIIGDAEYGEYRKNIPFMHSSLFGWNLDKKSATDFINRSTGNERFVVIVHMQEIE